MTRRFRRKFFANRGGAVGIAITLLVVAVAAGAPWLYPGDPLDAVARPLLPPFEDARYLLGTDRSGRDIAAGIAHGARVSLMIGVTAAAGADPDRHGDRRARRFLSRPGRRCADAAYRRGADRAELPARSCADRGARTRDLERHPGDRAGVVAGHGPHRPRRIPFAARARVRARGPHHGHGRRPADLRSDAAERGLVDRGARDRGGIGGDPGRIRAQLSRARRSERGQLGRHDRGRAAGVPLGLDRVGDPRLRHRADRARREPDRRSADRRPQPAQMRRPMGRSGK